jgi:hypothetical protein
VGGFIPKNNPTVFYRTTTYLLLEAENITEICSNEDDRDSEDDE